MVMTWLYKSLCENKTYLSHLRKSSLICAVVVRYLASNCSVDQVRDTENRVSCDGTLREIKIAQVPHYSLLIPCNSVEPTYCICIRNFKPEASNCSLNIMV